MIDHVTADVADLDSAKVFYADVLAPLGYSLQMEVEGAAAGFGTGEGIPDFWISSRRNGARRILRSQAERLSGFCDPAPAVHGLTHLAGRGGVCRAIDPGALARRPERATWAKKRTLRSLSRPGS